jgi:IclR family transcriptional regulator, blcABC operon repressor
VRTQARELPKATAPSVLKAARLLDELAASRDPLTLGDLSARMALPKSSTLSLCTSLTVSGLLRRYDDGTYHLGTHVVDLAHAYLSRTDLTREFDQALDGCPTLNEAGAVLAIRDGAEVVYLACRNGCQAIGLTYRIGMRLSVSCTATGKALISTLDDDAVRALFRNRPLPRLTARSHRTVKALLADLQVVRARGHALDDEETHPGMCCFGVPIHDPDGGPVLASVAVSTIKGQMSQAREAETIAALKELAKALQNRLKLLR